MACDRSCRPNSSRGRCSCRNSWPFRAAESAAFPCPEGLAVDRSAPAAAVRATARALLARCRRFHEVPWLARRLYRLGGCRAGTGCKPGSAVAVFSPLACLLLRPRPERGSCRPATACMQLRLLPIGVDALKFPPRVVQVDVMPHGRAVRVPPEVLAPGRGALPPGAATGSVARPSRHPKGIARATSGPRTMKPSDSVQYRPCPAGADEPHLGRHYRPRENRGDGQAGNEAASPWRPPCAVSSRPFPPGPSS